MADKLTREQSLAVHNRGGKLLVSAAAGSGKTKVLVDRLLTYLTEEKDPANLDEFLIITYTKAAATELRGKIAAKLTERIAQEPENLHLQKQMQRLFLTKISTVHGFCADILRQYAYKLDIAPDFRVADENECREIRKQVMTDLLDQAYEKAEDNSTFRSFLDTQGLGRDDRLVPQIIERVYDSAQCHLNPDAWLEKALDAAFAENLTDPAQTIWGAYLIEDFHRYLDAQISVFSQCIAMAESAEGFEKVSINLHATLVQLQALRQAQTWEAVFQNAKIDYGRLTFPRKNGNPELTDRIKAARNACKKSLEKKLQTFSDDAQQVLSDLAQCHAGTEGLIGLVRSFSANFRQAKRSRRVLDFGDLEHLTLDLLLGKSRTNPSSAAKEIGRLYREILVDEYQDSNSVQDAIFEVLTRERHNLFMVGDVKQSIYQFRLADPGIFLEKYASFLPAEEASPMEGRKVLLSHNFRSGGEIVEAVNDVFRCCMRREVGGLDYGDAEALREGVPHKALADPAVCLYALEVQEDTYLEEAAFVAQQIDGMLKNRTLVRKGDNFVPVEPEDIVILLRSPGSVGGHFQRALEDRGIRCASGGGMDLLQTQEIAAFRSFLQIIVNPQQDIPLISTLASPLFGFTADEMAEIRSANKRGSFYDALLASRKEKATEFLTVLSSLRQEARMNTLTQLLEQCIRLTRMDSIFGAMPGGKVKQANIQTFFQLAADFEMGSVRDLGQFLDHLESLQDRGLTVNDNTPSGCVTIMSIHKSKGLEFPVVFLAGLARSFNRESLQAQILCDKDLGLGLAVADTANRVRYPSIAKRAIGVKMMAESLSEEMRILYVAMTRARDRLIMTYAPRNLENILQEIAARYDLDQGKLLCAEADCPGDWVMTAAMQRMEAGQIHQLGGRPDHLTMAQFPWHIQVVSAQMERQIVSRQDVLHGEISSSDIVRLKDALSFTYPHAAATKAPSKQTATGRKGRAKDEEAAENTADARPRMFDWRSPSFASGKKGGTVLGNAVHKVMQYIRFDACMDSAGVSQEIHRLTDKGFLTSEEAELVDCHQIAVFFQSPIGQKLRQGNNHLREFKFSILDRGDAYAPGLEEEEILLQGVVDCALLEADGITILDFKTDYVTEESLPQAIQRYQVQIDTYADAMSRIYEMPVKEKFLYFFRLGRLVSIV